MPKTPFARAQTVGQRIKAAYEAKGLNRSQFQRALGVAYTTITRWEDESTAAPSAEHLEAIAAITGVSVDELLGAAGSADEPRPAGVLEAVLVYMRGPGAGRVSPEHAARLSAQAFGGLGRAPTADDVALEHARMLAEDARRALPEPAIGVRPRQGRRKIGGKP